MRSFETICILGMGYIGLPTATMFASKGKKVVGVDINSNIIDALQNQIVPIEEPGLNEVLAVVFKSGNLIPASQPEKADAFIISVPTPFNSDKTADLSAVKKATESIVPFLEEGNLVILESTSPPKTTIDVVLPILEKSGLIAGKDFKLAYSPERVLPGRILEELVHNDRVIGGIDAESAEAGKELYRTFVEGKIILTDTVTAEMVKLMENTFRDVNIAIANEFSRLAERFGTNIWEAIQIANLHPRVNILNPGPGVGGHCISVDPWFLVESAPDITPLIKQAREVNDSQPEFVVAKLKSVFNGEISGKIVAALGLAYKPDVDDMRESPAVEVVHLLQKEGCTVKAFDPYAAGKEIKNVQIVDALEEACEFTDVVILLVGHKEFVGLSADQLIKYSSSAVFLDTINAWSVEDYSKHGMKLYKLGVGK